MAVYRKQAATMSSQHFSYKQTDTVVQSNVYKSLSLENIDQAEWHADLGKCKEPHISF